MPKKCQNNQILTDLISEIETDIFDEQVWINQKMRKIAEVTYSYKSFYKVDKKYDLNYTLFCEIGELDFPEFIKKSKSEQRTLIDTATLVLKNKIEQKKEGINIYSKKLHTLYNSGDFQQHELYTLEIVINALQEKIDLLDYCLLGLDYELEKAGYKKVLKTKKIDEALSQLDKKLFGGRVLDNKSELQLCYKELIHNYLNNYYKLSEKEVIVYESYLHRVEKFLPADFQFIEKNEPKNLLEKFETLSIDDTRYIPGFNFFLESMQGLSHVAMQNDEAGSISDGPNSIEFPKGGAFSSLALARILRLNIHEIETHSITDHNHKQLIGGIRGAKSIEKDEGLAMFMENILQFGNQLLTYDEETGKVIYDINKFKLGQNLNYILMAEVLSNQEFIDFLQIHSKLIESNIPAYDRYLRLKRSNKNRVQYKDSSYTRGLIKVVETINEYIISNGEKGYKPERLFLGKIGFQETYKLQEIKKQKIINGEKPYILLPIFASDAVIYSIDCKEKGIPIYEEGFLKYLEDKYPFFSFKEKRIKLISHSIKRNITSIVDIFWDKMQDNKTIKQNEKFLLMLANSARRLSDDRKEIVEKYIGTESH